MTVTSMPSRSMSSRRLCGSVMPGRERLSTRAVPRVSLTPTPGRFANCCFTRSRRAAMCGWNSRGRRSCQSAGSPPWPSASITKWPNLPMGAPSEGEDAAREPPGAQVVERGGELVERVAACDEVVELEPAAEVEVGEHREVAARAGRAVAAAEDRLVLVEGVDHEVEPRADLRHADDGERAARAERVERLADDGEVADRLEGVVGAAAREIADGGDGVVLPGVDRVRGAETARQLELRGHGVALPDGGDARADGVHHAGALVAEDDGCGVGDRAVDDAQVRVAEAGGADRDPHLARTRVADAHLLDGDRLAGGTEDGGPHDVAVPILSTRPGRSRVSWPLATIVFPFTMARTTPSGRTCQRSSPPGMSRTSCFLPRPMRVGSNLLRSAGQPRTRMPRVRMPVSSAGRRVIRRTPSSSGRIWRSSSHERR